MARKKKCEEISYPAMYKKIKSDVDYIMTLINVEKFFADTTLVANTVSTTATIGSLVAIGQGDGESARTGNSILYQTLQWKGNVTMDPTAVTTAFRFIIMKDTECIGANPSIGNVLQQTTVPNSLYNELTQVKGRFVKIHDQYINLSADHINHRLGGKRRVRGHMQYIGTSSATTDLGRGNLFYILLSDQATLVPTVNLTFRVHYTDN